MSNFGDVPGKFSWNNGEYQKNFTLVPDHAIIPPHEDLQLTITFHPSKVDKFKYEKIPCDIAGGDPIFITLLGTCVGYDGKTDEVKFETIVRKSITQNVSIQNPTDKEWQIRPSISQQEEVFKGDASLTVPAKGNANYVVTYNPQRMTVGKKKVRVGEEEKEVDDLHEATLFFPLPDG